MMRFSKELAAALKAAQGVLSGHGQRELTPEHLLLGLCGSEAGTRLLRSCAVDIARLRAELADLCARLPRQRGRPRQSESLQRVIQRAALHAVAADREEVQTGDLLSAYFLEPAVPATALLKRLGATRLSLLRMLSHGIADFPPPPLPAAEGPEGPNGMDRLRVVLHNDDFTTMEFVEQVLEEVFLKPPGDATDIMFDVHRQGEAVVGTYPRELALLAVATVLKRAAEAEFPLLCTVQPVPAGPSRTRP